MTLIKVIIDPLVNVYYAGFYIKGLIELFGKKNIKFKSSPFKKVKNRDSNFNFIVIQNDNVKKITIDLDDSYEIKKECYDWCDVYGNVNTNWIETPDEFKDKLICLAPNFGIKIWNLRDTIYYAISNYFNTDIRVNLKRFFGRYKKQYLLRLPIENYKQKISLNNYIFHVSTLWQSDEWVRNDEFVNRIRALFISACKSINEINFEGGFYFSGNHKLNETYKHLVFDKFMPIKVYFSKLQQSVLVFNTPAWLNCNGWKLAEYLALGKAIISTKLFNDLPAPLIHGENIHFVDDDIDQIIKAIYLILNDKEYRIKLENGALTYWEKYGTPKKSLELLGL